MPKAQIGFENMNDAFLRTTEVENLFINEFLPAASGEHVKLYIYGMMHSKYVHSMDMLEASVVLGMTPAEVKEGWEYWARNGLVRLSYDDNGEIVGVEYISLINQLYGNKNKAAEPEHKPTDDTGFRMERIVNDEIRALYDQYEEVTGHTISQKEIRKIAEAIKEYHISVDVMGYAIKYCAEIEKYNIDYMFKVALRWTKDGCRDISQVKENLDRYSRKNEQYATIFKEMGFYRTPNPADKEMIDRWFDEMGFTLREVLDACRTTAGTRDPSLKYVNRVLENKQLEAGGIDTKAMYRNRSTAAAQTASKQETARVSKRVLKEYYDYLRTEAERVQGAHIDEVCANSEELRRLMELENTLNAELLTGAVMMDKGKRASLKEQRKVLEEEKRQLLRENGYTEDYLDRKYKCDVCGDTGITDEGNYCVCSKARAEEAFKWYQTITLKTQQ